MNTPKLPPLPHWCEAGSPFAEQMQAYAIAAITAQGVPEIDYEALIAAAHKRDRKWAQGTNGCIAFKYGAEWFRDQFLAAAPPAPQATRCELCQYQHGHQIGCANNPVDIALKAQAQHLASSAPQAHQQAITDPAAEQAAVVQQEQTCGEWVERWHGSRTEEGWSILFQSLIPRDKVAYLGTSVSAEAVQAIVSAHNKALSTKQAKPQPLSDEQINNICLRASYFAHGPARADFVSGIRAAEAAHGIKE